MPQEKNAGGQGPAIVGYQEGSRWFNVRPTGDEVASWFKGNVKIHEGLDAADYVSGVVMIGGKETIKVSKVAQGGSLQIVDEERLAFTPYAKIETRVKYFWDLMAKRPEVVGAIETVDMARLDTAGVYNLNMPPGFYRTPWQLLDGKFAHYVGCSMRVALYKADTLEWVTRDIVRKAADGSTEVEEIPWLRGTPVALYPPATKMIATLGKHGEDPFSMMKAETGAIGRALGMAGMLVIPGSGIATAEDMHEAQAGASGVGLGESAQIPDTPLPANEPEVEVRDRIKEKIVGLQSTNSEAYEKLASWAEERKIDLDNPKETQLRGLLLQLERLGA